MNLVTILLGGSLLCIVGGMFMYPDATSTIRPEFKKELTNRGVFWHTDWFVPAARPQIRRARSVQLAGVGLLVALMVWGWLS